MQRRALLYFGIYCWSNLAELQDASGLQIYWKDVSHHHQFCSLMEFHISFLYFCMSVCIFYQVVHMCFFPTFCMPRPLPLPYPIISSPPFLFPIIHFINSLMRQCLMRERQEILDSVNSLSCLMATQLLLNTE